MGPGPESLGQWPWGLGQRVQTYEQTDGRMNGQTELSNILRILQDVAPLSPLPMKHVVVVVAPDDDVITFK